MYKRQSIHWLASANKKTRYAVYTAHVQIWVSFVQKTVTSSTFRFEFFFFFILCKRAFTWHASPEITRLISFITRSFWVKDLWLFGIRQVVDSILEQSEHCGSYTKTSFIDRIAIARQTTCIVWNRINKNTLTVNQDGIFRSEKYRSYELTCENHPGVIKPSSVR